MDTAAYLAVFFGRAARTVRRRFGPDAYVDASGEQVAILNNGGILGTGATLRDAWRSAAALPLCANCNRTPVADMDDRFCRGCRPFVRAMA